MNVHKTKIEWCSHTWNPVTGCRHGCEYCYAQRIVSRFEPKIDEWPDEAITTAPSADGGPELYVVERPTRLKTKEGGYRRPTPYPKGFAPTLHAYTLTYPEQRKAPSNIFVCSMADLFGYWVPDEWIAEVLKACDAAPQHRYLFLTKAPSRYEKISSLMPSWEEMYLEKSRPVMMFGASATDDAMMAVAYKSNAEWVSVEPILEPIEPEWFISASGSNGDYSTFRRWEWVVIGAETGNSKHKTVPKREWVEEIVKVCKEYGTPVFMKDSLRDLMRDGFRQEFPWIVGGSELF